jgi:ribonuclease HI
MSKAKFYVVWKGHKPGVYDSWDVCRQQVAGHDGALHKSFASRSEAELAYHKGPWAYIGKDSAKAIKRKSVAASTNIISNSISVDAAWNTETKVMEYRGVETASGKEIFHGGPYPDATNNIGEFLAIVHGISLLKKHNINIPVYTDSLTAMTWVRNKKAKTKLAPTKNNAIIFDLIARAEKWLCENTYPNLLIKWETASWGEIPADFGRK